MFQSCVMDFINTKVVRNCEEETADKIECEITSPGIYYDLWLLTQNPFIDLTSSSAAF